MKSPQLEGEICKTHYPPFGYTCLKCGEFVPDIQSKPMTNSNSEAVEKIDLDLMLAMVQSTTEDTPHAEMVEMIGNIRKYVPTALSQAQESGRREERERLMPIIDDLTDPDDCSFDHHGYCQAHHWMETEPKCPHARSKSKIKTDFYGTIPHQELEKWLHDKRDSRVEISNDDGTSYVIETGENKFVLVKVTNELLDSVVIKIIDHDLSVGNENTEVV